MAMSPPGGTTSLPQYLQQRQPTKPGTTPTVTPPAMPGAIPKPAANATFNPFIPGGGQPLTPPTPGASRPGTQAPNGLNAPPAPNPGPGPAGPLPVNPNSPVAPPPPAPPAAPPAPAPRGDDLGAPTSQPAPGTAPAAPPGPPGGLLKYLMDIMQGGNSRYSDDMINATRESGHQQLDDYNKQQQDQIQSELAKHGMLGSSRLTTSMGDLSERVSRIAGQQENDLQRSIADANATDKQNAISNIFSFGNGENQSKTTDANVRGTDANILNILAQLGSQGEPTIPGAVGDYGSLPQPAGPTDNSGIYDYLGRLFGPRAPAAAI